MATKDTKLIKPQNIAVNASNQKTTAIVWDFEDGTMQGWQVVVGKLAHPVSCCPNARNTPNAPFPRQGKYHLTSLDIDDVGGYNDDQTAIVISPVFDAHTDIIKLLVGGGVSKPTYVALCDLKGNELYVARGRNEEKLYEVIWDVKKHKNTPLFIKMVDLGKGSWSHIHVDDVHINGVLRPELNAKAAKLVQDHWQDANVEAKKEMVNRNALRKENADPKKLLVTGTQRVYTGKYLKAISVPLGGIGSGCIQITGHGERVYQTFNNFSYNKLPNSFFGLAMSVGGKTQLRALKAKDEGAFKGWTPESFRGEYPWCEWDFREKGLPVEVTMNAFSPFIPMNLKDSSNPVVIFRFTLRNTTDKAVSLRLLGVHRNAVGQRDSVAPEGKEHPTYGQNSNEIRHQNALTTLYMSGPDGNMSLAVNGNVKGCASLRDNAELAKPMSAQNQAGPTPNGSTIDGALEVPISLQPGEAKTVSFALSWFFPGAVNGNSVRASRWTFDGNFYETKWQNSQQVTNWALGNIERLVKETKLFHDTLYSSNLPRYILDRASSQLAILVSKTCFWSRSGFFGMWEGCCEAGSGCCEGNCLHVWHYAQGHAWLFPELGRMMRVQEMGNIKPDGMLPHRIAEGHAPAADGLYGCILGTYREHLLTPNENWLKKNWAKLKPAMDWSIKTWDPDEDGFMSGPQWNTLDSALDGCSSWLGSMYLAALKACVQMATICGDHGAASRYEAIFRKGYVNQGDKLFNGEYYLQIPGPTPRNDYNDGSIIDQVLGQWWADLLHLGDVYPRARVKKAVRAIYKYNFHPLMGNRPQVPRKFVADFDGGTQMVVWPKNNPPAVTIPYASECMSGFEYSAASAMVQNGDVEQGYRVVKAIADRYDGYLRDDLTGGNTASWGYSGNPFGDDECGKFYGRALSSWSMVPASQGLILDGPKGILGFNPQWQPQDHRSFFPVPQGYGLFTQTVRDGQQTDTIRMMAGGIELKQIVLQSYAGRAVRSVKLIINGVMLKSSYRVQNGQITIKLAEPLKISAGHVLTANIALR